MDSKDYYQILGVAKTATADDIKKAYRKLVRKYHPDVSKAANADRMTQDINEAYSVLGDAEKRAAYDALGRSQAAGQQFHAPPGWHSAFDYNGGDGSDFFADLFSQMRRREGGAGTAFHMRGDDVHAAVTVTLHDAYRGANRTVRLRTPEADASGRIVTRERLVKVHIPRGVQPGQQLRLAGQGNAGHGGAPAGELYLEVQFEPDPRFEVLGRNVTAHVPVAPWEAALGAQVDVDTPSGTLEVAVPAGSQPGRKLRLKGRGIPGPPDGDLFLVLDLVLPPANSERARQLYQAMARELDFNPRARAGA